MFARRLFRRGENQPCPACKETKATNRSDGAKPAQISQCQEVETAAKQHDSDKKQPPCATIDRAVKRKCKQRNRVNEMIKHRLVPHFQHAPRFQSRSEAVRAEGP